MPVWLQLTAALTAAVSAGVMGAALVPYLRRLRFCEPEQPKDGETAGEQLRPTMGGLLTVFGCVIGVAVSGMLYLRFAGADRTSLRVQQESTAAVLALGYALLLAAAGCVSDYLTVRRRLRYRVHPLMQAGGVFLAALAFCLLLGQCTGMGSTLDLGFAQWEAGALAAPVRAAVMALFWLSMQYTEHETDGVSIACGGILLLVPALLAVAEGNAMQALTAFAAVGACMGCMIWNLHPAKCRLGRTGSCFLGGMLPALCILHGSLRGTVLLWAVYAVNLLPLLTGRGTLIAVTERARLRPWQRIVLLAGFAGFCGVLAVLAG